MIADRVSSGWRHLAGVLLALATCFSPGAARARGQDLGDVVSRLPDSVEFVAALDDAATLRASLGDSPLMLALSSMTRPARVIDAWSELSADLGLTSEEAFDLLLGRRVVFLASGLKAGDAQTRWAVLSELDPVTERRFRVDLGAVPRRLVAGQLVLELEHGTFLMATSSGRLRCAPGGRFEPAPDSTILLLAPAEDREFFEALLPLLHCQAAQHPLGDLPGGAAARTLPAGDGVLLWRMPDPALAPDRFIAASLRFDDGSWRLHAIAGPTRGWMPDADPSLIAPWSPRLLMTLPDSPVFAMMGLRGIVQEARQVVVPLLTTPLPGPEAAEFHPLLGDRSLIAVWLNGTQAEQPPRLEMLNATEVKNLVAVANRAKGLVQSKDGLGGARWSVHEDLAPQGSASDLTMLRFTPSETAPPGAPEINWAFVPEAGDSAGGRGWWLVHQGETIDGPHSSSDLSSPAAEASRDGVAPTRRYLHAGMARPWALIQSHGVTDIGMGLLPGGSVTSLVMSRIDRLEWAVWASEDGRTLEADLRIMPPATGPGK